MQKGTQARQARARMIRLPVVGAAAAFAFAPLVQAEIRAGDGGCSKVTSIVYERVLAYGLDRAPLRAGTVIVDGELHCDRVAEAVSLGFTAAMRRMNVHLSWKSPSRMRGDLCLDVHLSHCFPDQDPRVPYPTGTRSFVADAWAAVQDAVAGADGRCPAGGNRLRVDGEGLRRHLDSTLGGQLRHGRQQAYALR